MAKRLGEHLVTFAGELELGFTVCNLAELANSFCKSKQYSLASESQLWHSCLFLHSAEPLHSSPCSLHQ